MVFFVLCFLFCFLNLLTVLKLVHCMLVHGFSLCVGVVCLFIFAFVIHMGTKQGRGQTD